MPAPDAITVRWAESSDRDAIAGLVEQTKRHYGEETETAAEIGTAVAGWLEAKPGNALFVVAFVGGAAQGYASVAVTPPAMGLAAALYLKELFVSPTARGRGVGHELLVFLAEFCLAENIERIDLTTATGNDAGIRFYEREGAAIQRQKVALRFETPSLERLAAARGKAR
ncbi:GNAT family N-acetyltransferase [Oricola nitratireducens]|uniref:GNAT family N-acetyltransferase n=1 Tax=Oricola nitratireducens TaxID=2775868 RepID=UPI0018677579|nr:GNAT family N-acetyltransferase [Oricola nitratireducens]